MSTNKNRVNLLFKLLNNITNLIFVISCKQESLFINNSEIQNHREKMINSINLKNTNTKLNHTKYYKHNSTQNNVLSKNSTLNKKQINNQKNIKKNNNIDKLKKEKKYKKVDQLSVNNNTIKLKKKKNNDIKAKKTIT